MSETFYFQHCNYCANCGEETLGEWNYCPYCGTYLWQPDHSVSRSIGIGLGGTSDASYYWDFKIPST